MNLVSTEDVVELFRNGKMCILTETGEAQAKGWLIMPAQMATPSAINFMATYGHGLVQLGLSGDRVRELGLEAMPTTSGRTRSTNDLISIEAKHGVTTGISAHDRARTITTAIDGNSGPDDIVTPGHVFPLASCEGGVLENPEPVEAAVDCARLAGLNASSVICAVVRDDGETARLADLLELAEKHDLKIGTIADLVRFRQVHDRLIARGEISAFESLWGGEWNARTYRHTRTGEKFLALTHGALNSDQPVPVLLHPISLLGDVFGKIGEHAGRVQSAMDLMGRKKAGVIIVMKPSDKSSGDLSNSFFEKVAQSNYETIYSIEHLSIAAQILHDLDVCSIELISSMHSHDALAKLGVEISHRIPLAADTTRPAQELVN